MPGVLIAVAVLAAVGGVFAIVGLALRHSLARLMREGVQTTATVVDSRREFDPGFGEGGSTSEVATVEFVTPDGRRVREKSRSSRPIGRYLVGEQVPIVYDPADTRRVYVLRAPGRVPADPIVFATLGFVVIGIALLVLLVGIAVAVLLP